MLKTCYNCKNFVKHLLFNETFRNSFMSATLANQLNFLHAEEQLRKASINDDSYDARSDDAVFFKNDVKYIDDITAPHAKEITQKELPLDSFLNRFRKN